MMRVLLDTNVVLDALLQCDPWAADAEAIWRAHADGRLVAHVTATTITDIFYVGRRLIGLDDAWKAIRTCLDQLWVVSVGANELLAAATNGQGDFEDSLQLACAIAAGLDAIVTRDAAGFSHGTITVLTPSELLQRMQP